MKEENQDFVLAAYLIYVCQTLVECMLFVLFQLQQLLTDLPHDMLEDSGDQLSSYSDSSVHETEEQ